MKEIRGHMITKHKIVDSTIYICKEVVVHVENYVNCEECGMGFANKYKLKTHLKTHHVRRGNGKSCGDCGKDFSKPFLLKIHMQKHDHGNKM